MADAGRGVRDHVVGQLLGDLRGEEARVREGEAVADVKQRLGKPAEERWSVRSERVRQDTGTAGTTTHVIEPAVEARFVRLNVTRPTYSGEPVARCLTVPRTIPL